MSTAKFKCVGALRKTTTNLYFLISATRCEAGAIWVKPCVVDHTAMILVRLQFSLCINVPDLQISVVAAGGDQAAVWAEHCVPDPVVVPSQRKQALSVIHTPDLDDFII